MTAVPITITTAGLAALVAAGGGGTAPITIAAIGVSASIFTPDPSMTALPGEIKRVTTISGGVIAPAVIHLGMMDNSADAYTLNGFGLYLADGTLFGVYSQSAAIYTKTAGSVGLLACDVTFEEGSASAVTFGATGFLNPPASPSVMGVVQLATNAQAIAGTDPGLVITAAALGAAFAANFPGGASETHYGLARLATLAQVEAGTDPTDVLTPATALAAFNAWLASANVLAGFTWTTDSSSNWKETRPNGVIEMGGFVAAPFTTEQLTSLTFPFGGFTSHCWDFSASAINSTGSISGDTQFQEVTLSKTGVTIYVQDHTDPFYDDAGGYRWRARGV